MAKVLEEVFNANGAPLPLLEELSRVVDSHGTKDQLIVMFQREVAKDAGKVREFRRRMQLHDMEKASRLLLMARETQLKAHEKTSFIVKMEGRVLV
ncbi:hypothetical protein Tco_0736446 [Tanacetum coccineum]